MRSIYTAFHATQILILAIASLACGCTGGTAKELTEGRRLYLSYGCGACHGMEGRGDGPAAASLKVAPRDFHQAGSFRGPRTVEALSTTIAKGFPGGVMPAFPYINQEERRLLAQFVLSLAPGSGS